MPKNTGFGSRHAAEYCRRMGKDPDKHLPNGGFHEHLSPRDIRRIRRRDKIKAIFLRLIK